MTRSHFELDHVFVCAPRAGEDAALLTAAGLCCGLNRTHPGQGTANANFYFDNAYLEVLWLGNEDEARSEAVRPIAMWQRLQWPVTGACPFGLSLRTDNPNGGELASWEYAAPFLPQGLTIPILSPRGEDSGPLVFLPPAAVAPAAYPPERKVPLEHKGRRLRLAKVHFQSPSGAVTTGLSEVVEAGLVSVKRGERHLMEVELDGDLEGQTLDFRPRLPLRIRW